MKIRKIITGFTVAAAVFFMSGRTFGVRLPENIDVSSLLNTRDVTIIGDNQNDSLGNSICSGDINGDGIDDLIIGANTANDGKGETIVIFGSNNFSDTDLIDLASSPSGVLIIYGEAAGDNSGYSVASGDVNGDNYDDVIIGAYKADLENIINAGEVYVIFGSSNIHLTGTIDLSGSPSGVMRIYGDDQEDALGFSLATGDINGDNIDDMILGAYGGDLPGKLNTGETYVIFGSTTFDSSNDDINLSTTPTPSGVLVIYGEAAGDNSGYSVASGDLNGSGYDEIIIGAPSAYNGKGGVYVIPGTADITDESFIDLTAASSVIVKVYGGNSNDCLGKSVATGDLNGNGYKDLIIGAPGVDTDTIIDAGETNVIMGGPDFKSWGVVYLKTLTTGVVRINGYAEYTGFGSALAAGDLNGDGNDELVVGSPEYSNNTGEFFVIYRAADFPLEGAINLADSTVKVSKISGAQAGDKLGSAVGFGDFNNDGFHDIAAGSPLSDYSGKSNTGKCFVITGFGTIDIITRSPDAGEYASKNSMITTFFNTDLDSVMVSVTDNLLENIPGSILLNQNSVEFIPSTIFDAGAQITVGISGWNMDGNFFPSFEWVFNIKEDEFPPELLDSSPSTNEENVSLDKNILLTFSSDVFGDSTTVIVHGNNQRIIEMTESWADSILTLVNDDSFELSETITVTINARDKYGDSSEYVYSFTTRPETDPPYFTVYVPENPEHLSKYAMIRLLFPFDIDKQTVETRLEGSLSGEITGAWIWADTTFTFTPPNSYTPGETLQLIVNASDIHKNTVSDSSITFTVKQDEIPPEILSYSPFHGENNVDLTAPVVIEFSNDLVRDSTAVVLTGNKQGTISVTKSWLDYTLTLSHEESFWLDDTFTVTVNVGDAYANREEFSWSFATGSELILTYYEVIEPSNYFLVDMFDLITLNFKNYVDLSTVGTVLVGSISGTFSETWNWTDSNYTFTPSNGYSYGETITLTVNASDKSNNSLQEKTHVFTVRESQSPWLERTEVILFNSLDYTYRINYTVNDPDGSYTTTTGWQYSIDGGEWVNINAANISGNDPQAPGDRFILWKLPNTLQGVYSENVRFRMQVTDGAFLSGLHTSPSFKVDWNQVPTVTITSAAANYTTNRSVITYTISDLENNNVSLLFEYSLDGGITWIACITDSNLSLLAPDEYTGSFDWDFTQGLETGIDYLDVRVRLTPSDYKVGVSSVSEPYQIDLNAPPSVKVEDITTLQSGDVGIGFHLSDAESDTIRFVCYYSINGGIDWVETAHVSNNQFITLYDGSVVWHSGMDIPSILSDNVRFRLEPWDSDKGTDDITENFTLINNSPPTVTVTLPDTAGKNVTIPYVIDDPENDPVTLHVMWSSDGQIWRPATVYGDTLDLKDDAYDGTLIWLSSKDTGVVFFETMYLRVFVTDEIHTLGTEGINYAENTFSLDNEAPFIISIMGFAKSDTVYFSFNEPVEQTDSLNPENYTFYQDFTVKSVIGIEGTNQFMLVLEDGQALTLNDCTLKITNIRDVYNNTAEQTIVFSPDDSNFSPSVTIEPIPQVVSGMVMFKYSITDPENDPVTLLVSYSTDGGNIWKNATVTGNTTDITSENYNGVFLWDTSIVFPGIVVENVLVKITAKDNDKGQPLITSPFTVDNNSPPSIKISIPDSDSLYNEVITISYVLSDQEEDLLSMVATYSINGGETYSPAAVSGTLSGIDHDNYSGILEWDTSTDFPDQYGQVIFKVIPSDAKEGAADSLFIWIDNLGISKVTITLPVGEQSSSIPVEYEIINTLGNDVSLFVSYSFDSGSTWNEATIDRDLSSIKPAQFSGTFNWLARNDLQGKEGTVQLKVLPNNGNDGIAFIGEVYVDYNEVPVLAVSDVEGEVSGDVTISYTVTDAETDTVNISLSYSTDNRSTWHDAESGGDIENIVANGSARSLIWYSDNDLPGREITNIWLRIAVSDLDSGESVDTGPVHLDNNIPPVAELAVDYPDSIYNDFIDIDIELSDEEEDILSITPSYSIDGGTVFHPATVTGPISDISKSNYTTSLLWDLTPDIPDYFGDVVFMILPSDNDEGIPGTITLSVNSYGTCSVTADLSDIQDSTVTMNYEITDLKQHDVSLKVEYSLDGGVTYHPAETIEQLTDIPPDSYKDSFVWRSMSDLTGYEGNVWLRITPNNGVDGLYTIQELQVDYNKPPVFELLTANQDTSFSGTVAVALRVSDAEADEPTMHMEFSLDSGITYTYATLADSTGIALETDTELIWMAFNDLGYVINAEVILRITAKDKDPGEPKVAGPFTVTNLVGDYTFDCIIDSGDLPFFLDAWNMQDVSKEIGPASGTVPNLTVEPDKKVDFEDLAVFVMMWNWYTDQIRAQKNIKYKPVDDNSGTDIQLVRRDNGSFSVISEIRPDFMSLVVDVTCKKETEITVQGSDYWTVENSGIVLTRPLDSNLFEMASGILDGESIITPEPCILANIRLRDALHIDDVIRVTYRLRRHGEAEIVEGTINYIIEEEPNPTPLNFSLLQNSPNPFNPSTTISFELPHDAHMRLSIYTIEGKLVTVLVDEFMRCGFHSITWDAKDMPSGIFFYSLKTDGFVKTRKMMLLK